MHWFAKPAYSQKLYRGFESLSLRHSTHSTSFRLLMAGPVPPSGLQLLKDVQCVECPEPVEGLSLVYLVLQQWILLWQATSTHYASLPVLRIGLMGPIGPIREKHRQFVCLVAKG